MDLEKMIEDLRAQLEGVEAAIAALERLAQGRKRRGRPPKWLKTVRTVVDGADSESEG